jgi:circadian clock protein KaiB
MLGPGAVSAKEFVQASPVDQPGRSVDGRQTTTHPRNAVSDYQFRLFVAGDSPHSRQAVANLRRLGEERLAGNYRLTVVDVIHDPASAEAARVLTTPTLVKDAPAPPRRVTGDLTDATQVMFALGLDGDLKYTIE